MLPDEQQGLVLIFHSECNCSEMARIDPMARWLDSLLTLGGNVSWVTFVLTIDGHDIHTQKTLTMNLMTMIYLHMVASCSVVISLVISFPVPWLLSEHQYWWYRNHLLIMHGMMIPSPLVLLSLASYNLVSLLPWLHLIWQSVSTLASTSCSYSFFAAVKCPFRVECLLDLFTHLDNHWDLWPSCPSASRYYHSSFCPR